MLEELLKESRIQTEILRKMEKAGTLDELFKDIDPPTIENTWQYMPDGDSYDYDSYKDAIYHRVAAYLCEAYKKLGIAKFCMGCQQKDYEKWMEDWQGYKKKCPKQWPTYITLPAHLRWFARYEQDHGITDSIFREAMTKRDIDIKDLLEGENGTKVCRRG